MKHRRVVTTTKGIANLRQLWLVSSFASAIAIWRGRATDGIDAWKGDPRL